MLIVDENVIPYLLKKLNVNLDSITRTLDRSIDSYPKVSGGEQQYLSNDATKALQKATGLSQEFKDEFVSIEHLLLGILSVNDAHFTIAKRERGYGEGSENCYPAASERFIRKQPERRRNL